MKKRPSASHQSGQKRDGPLRIACEALVTCILFGAIQTIHAGTLMAQTGAPYLEYEVDRSYRIMAHDICDIAQQVSELLTSENLLKTCHMYCVRFYVNTVCG